MLKRIKRIIELSKKDPEKVNALLDEQVDSIPEIGDGGAVFLGEGTHDEYEDMLKEDKGVKGWYDRIKNLGKEDEL